MVPFDSIGLICVLHCLPGSMGEKFGATILGRGIAPNAAARALLDLYNENGVFNNREDDADGLAEGLRQRFDTVEIERQGCVALFRAR